LVEDSNRPGRILEADIFINGMRYDGALALNALLDAVTLR
jgi:hypothetical protein